MAQQVLAGRAPSTPYQSTGTVEVALTEYGGDFAMNTTNNPGDLVLLLDTPKVAPATDQRLTIMCGTSPRRILNGVPTLADDIFNPTFGLGLPWYVYQLQTVALQDEMAAAATNGFANDIGVASSPDPIVAVTYPDSVTTVLAVEYDAVTGAVSAISYQQKSGG